MTIFWIKSVSGLSRLDFWSLRWSIRFSPLTGTQDWCYDEKGTILHFPVDHYFSQGKRRALFLGEEVTKYHRTLTTYLDTLLRRGFRLLRVVEPQPSEELLRQVPDMKEELRPPP